MTVYQGHLRKMRTSLIGSAAQYQLPMGDELVDCRALIGKQVQLSWDGSIECVQCGRATKKSFQQGHCYPCMQKINECNNCIIHPERCLVEQGCCDPTHWAHQQCDAPHVVYIANTSGLKVGITRATNVPSRWVDQGAMQAIPIFTTQNRYQAGLVEVALKSHVGDKTQWRTMLKQDSVPMTLADEARRIITSAAPALDDLMSRYPDDIQRLSEEAIDIAFPSHYLEKITSFSLDKTAEVSGTLQGLKAQYWMLADGVINIRKFAGYAVTLTVTD